MGKIMNHFKLVSFLLIIFLLSNVGINAQLLMGQAPLKPGNCWKYYTISPNSLDSVSFKVLDSTIIVDGNEFYVIEIGDQFTTSHIYYGLRPDSFYIRLDEFAEDSIYKYFKLGADLGDSWTQIHFNTLIDFTVIDTFTINAWLVNYHAKMIYVDTHGLVEIYQTWTDSLGLMYEYNVGHYEAGLAGCVINGKVYGDTTMYVTSVEEDDPFIKDFNLLQNYPNPFNPVTTIEYQITRSDNVKLKIYNVLGQEIKTLVDQFQDVGNYKTLFDGTGLPSGIYCYAIETDNKTITKAMILLK